jgi:hypothetical protein
MNKATVTKILLIVAGIAVALLTVWVFQRPAVQPPVADQQSIPDDPDGLVLKGLVANGADLSKPHKLEFLLYLPDQERATKVCETLKTEGYAGTAERGAQGSQWKCLATKSLVPSHAAILAIGSRMQDLARLHGGTYDGWGAFVVP